MGKRTALGESLRLKRKAAGLDLVKVSEETKHYYDHLTISTISKFERGEEVPTDEQIRMLNEIYGAQE